MAERKAPSSDARQAERAKLTAEVSHRAGPTGSPGDQPAMAMPLREKRPSFRHGPKTDWSRHPILYLVPLLAVVLILLVYLI